MTDTTHHDPKDEELARLRERCDLYESIGAGNTNLIESPEAQVQQQQARMTWQPIATAPKDCTLVFLRLAQDDMLDHAIEGEESHPPRTIGHNNFEHDGIDEWHFAGWNWEQDCYTEGYGTPTHWMHLHSATTDDLSALKAHDDALWNEALTTGIEWQATRGHTLDADDYGNELRSLKR